MPTQSQWVSANHATVRMNVHEIVAKLNEHLGATLVATLAGVNDRKLPYRWAKPDGPRPGDDAQQRLQAAHRLWLVLSQSESDHVVRSWFIGANPLLNDTPPVMALREGDLTGTKEAANAFIDGTWHD